MIKSLFVALFSIVLASGSAYASASEHTEHAAAEDGHGHAAVDGHAASAHGASAAHAPAHHGPPPINWLDFGYSKKDVHGGSLEKGEEQMAPPLAVALFNFVVFITILFFKIPGTPIGLNLAAKMRDSYSAKHVSIKEGLEEGARLRKEAEAKLAEYGQRIKDVDSEVNQLITQIKTDAEDERRRLVAKAEQQAEQTKKDAEQRIAAEISHAKKQLERDVILAATAAAQTSLQKGTNSSDQQNLFDQFMTQLDTHIGQNSPGAASVVASSSKAPTNDEGWS